MPSLERRVAALESSQGYIDIRGMTDEELESHVKTLELGSPAFYDAVLMLVGRRGSTLPIVAIDPDYVSHDQHPTAT